MSSPVPYNISILSQCPNFQFYPARDGPIDKGWNVTYSDSDDTEYEQDDSGSGTPSHRTSLPGAYVELNWTGTAIYLYGTAAVNSVYNISVDGSSVYGSPDSTNQLLGSVSGLAYGVHKLRLSTGDNRLFSFQRAVLTVGIGFEGDLINNQTISMVTSAQDGVSIYNQNPFYNFSSTGTGPRSWFISSGTQEPEDGETNLIPQVLTYNDGDSFSFKLNQTIAFFLHGSMNWDHDSFIVTVKPLSNSSVPGQQFNHTQRWLEVDTILYFNTDMDPSSAYEILFENVGIGRAFGVRYVELMQVSRSAATSSPFSSPSSSSTTSPTTSPHLNSVLSSGAIAGISAATGIFVALACLIIGYFLLFRSRRGIKNIFKNSSPDPLQLIPFHHDPHLQVLSKTTPSSILPQSPREVQERAPSVSTPTQPSTLMIPGPSLQEIDAGRVPLDTAPPNYNPAWQTE